MLSVMWQHPAMHPAHMALGLETPALPCQGADLPQRPLHRLQSCLMLALCLHTCKGRQTWLPSTLLVLYSYSAVNSLLQH